MQEQLQVLLVVVASVHEQRLPLDTENLETTRLVDAKCSGIPGFRCKLQLLESGKCADPAEDLIEHASSKAGASPGFSVRISGWTLESGDGLDGRRLRRDRGLLPA